MSQSPPEVPTPAPPQSSRKWSPDLTQHQDTIFEKAPFGLAIVGPQGHFGRTNAALQSMFGRSAAELAQLRFSDITHPDELNADTASFQQVMRGQLARFQREKRYRHAHGHYVWVWITAIALTDPETGAYCGTLSYFIDISASRASRAGPAPASVRTRVIRRRYGVMITYP